MLTDVSRFKAHFGNSDSSTDEGGESGDMESDWVDLGELSEEERVKEEVQARLAGMESMRKDEDVLGEFGEESVLSDPDVEEFDIVEWDEFVAGEIPDEDTK